MLTREELNVRNLLTIGLEYQDVDAVSLAVGKKVDATDAELFDSVLSMCAAIDLTDCVKGVSVDSNPEFRDVVFYTYSGVNIQIRTATIRGQEKIQRAIESYHNAKDYYKTFDTITVFILEEDGSIQCEWTSWQKGE